MKPLVLWLESPHFLPMTRKLYKYSMYQPSKSDPIGDGVYAVDPNSSWPPSRGEYKMKDEMSRNSIVQIKEDMKDIKNDIEKIERKVFNGK